MSADQGAGEVCVSIKSAFGLNAATAKETYADPYVRISLIDANKNKQIDSLTTTVLASSLDPEWDEDFVFAKISYKLGNLSLKFEVFDSADAGPVNPKKDEVLGTCFVHELRRVRSCEVQRKLLNVKTSTPIDGLLFLEYSFIPEKHPDDGQGQADDIPEADVIDGDDAGCFCGHVYCEAIDAIDLNVDHLLGEDDLPEQTGSQNLMAAGRTRNVEWSTILEFSCSKQGKNKTQPFKWRSLEIEGTGNPSWNEGCCFPIDFDSSDALRPVKVCIYQEEQAIGMTLCDIPLTPTMRVYVKRIHDEDFMECRGYIVIKVGFVPFGFQLSDMDHQTIMDGNSTADFLGMRRKYADICAQNSDFQSALAVLQDKIDELEGLKKEDDLRLQRETRHKEVKKGPSTRAMWAFFAMISEPWSKASKVSAYKLRQCLEQGVPERRRQVLPLIRACTTQPYLSFKEFNLVVTEFQVSKKEWRALIRCLNLMNQPKPDDANTSQLYEDLELS